VTVELFERRLLLAQAGDEEAFAAIWRHSHPGLVRYLRVMAGPEADDLAADTWLQVARTFDRFTGNQASFRAWLFTIARHRCIDWRRQQGRRGTRIVAAEGLPEEASEDDTEAMVEDATSTEAAVALIARLPPDQAEAVYLRVIADLDVATVAEIMGRQPGAVRVLAHRGLRRLGDLLRGAMAPTQQDASAGGASSSVRSR
jgi:RNA polymerase sigma-70 factor (ECF subfamily)